jgi:hypothetical protein
MKKFSIRAVLASVLMFVVVLILVGVYALAMVAVGRGSEQAPSWVNITLRGSEILVLASTVLFGLSHCREIWEALRDMWRAGGV